MSPDIAAYLEATSFGIVRSLEFFRNELRHLQTDPEQPDFQEVIVYVEAALVHMRACRDHLPMIEKQRRLYRSPTLRFLGVAGNKGGGQ